MAAQHPRTEEAAGRSTPSLDTATPPPAPLAPTDRDLQRLGTALQARTDDVVKLTVERTIESGQVVDALIQDSFERICRISTIAA